MNWTVEYLDAALRDLKKIEPHNRLLILKAIEKVAMRPLPPPDGIGKPLGNHASSKLAGYFKIKLKDNLLLHRRSSRRHHIHTSSFSSLLSVCDFLHIPRAAGPPAYHTVFAGCIQNNFPLAFSPHFI